MKLSLDLGKLDTSDLLKNIITQSEVLELLSNGLYPGLAAGKVDKCINYIDGIRGHIIDEFVLRPDAEETNPQVFAQIKEQINKMNNVDPNAQPGIRG